MQTERRKLWSIAFIVTLVLLAAVYCYGHDNLLLFNRATDLIILFVGWIILTLLALPFVSIVTRIAGRKVKSACVSTGLSLALAILLTHVAYVWCVSNSSSIAKAKAYVALADPSLETYYNKHGKYPESLKELNLSVSPPFLLDYTSNSTGLEWGASTGHREVYQFEFGDLYYLGNGVWNFGGL